MQRLRNPLCSWIRCVVLLALLGAGHPGWAETKPNKLGEPDSVADLPSQAGSLDVAFLRLNMGIHSFVGMYWDEAGVLKVTLRNMSDAEAARPKILKFLHDNYPSSDKSATATQIKFQEAKTEFNWFQIYRYKTALRDVLTIQDTVLLDADEVCGCVAIGISNERARSIVENFIKQAGVPPSAVRIRLMNPVIPLQDVTNNFRPMVGGTQIKNDAGTFAFLGFSDVCTLTVVANRLGITGFITASHCTRIQGGVEATSFYQNGAPFGLDYVAHESADPVWAPGGPSCPTGMFCRSSDSAFAVIDIGNQNGALATIARPTTLCLTSPTCSLAMPSSTSALTVTGVAGPPLFGSLVTKVGRTTGWTGGTVTATCADIPQSGTSFVALCTSCASAGSQGGDSGAPVFTIPPGSGAAATTGTLVGIVWGGDTTGTLIAFSPIGAVLGELGLISLFPATGGTTGPTPPPPSACVQSCRNERDACMKSVAEPDGPTPKECVALYRGCLNDCK